MNKDEAQARADRIRAFQDELAALRDAGVLTLAPDEADRLRQHHDDLLRKLLRRFDIDTSRDQKQLSLGMRLASLFGALALSAAVFLFFYRFWGGISTPLQVGLLVTAPLLGIIGVELAARRERSLYFASLIALVAGACFVLDLTVLGQIFNITPSPNALLAWAAFALLLAYSYGLRLILVAGLFCLTFWLAAMIGTLGGSYWTSFGERPEHFILAGLAVFAAGLVRQSAWPGFAGIYRAYGLLVLFIAILVLANWGQASYLLFTNQAIENSYQLLGFAAAGLTIWLGIRRHWPGVVNLGSTFFVLYLYTKLIDWWWEWMPKYLFFLLLGLVAVGLLLVLRKLRDRAMRRLA